MAAFLKNDIGQNAIRNYLCSRLADFDTKVNPLSVCLSVLETTVITHTRYRALGPELIPVYRQSSPTVISCHYFPPGLRLSP